MAIAKAECTCERCGKAFTFRKNCLNRRDADSFEEWARANITVCDDCKEFDKQEQRRQEEIRAAEEQEENGYPSLSGSDKQIAWANRIRQKFIDDFSEHPFAKDEERCDFVRYVIENVVSAHEWIDLSSDIGVMFMFNSFFRAYGSKWKESRQNDVKTAQDVRAEATVTPENGNGITVEIEHIGETVTVKSPKDNTVIDTVKEHGFRWDSEARFWIRRMSSVSGAASDRIGEIGNMLLKKGYTVVIMDEDARLKAVNGNYADECKRWILSGNNGLLRVRFEKNKSLYEDAIGIKGSTYNDGTVFVPVVRNAELLDFANINGFQISDAAMRQIDEYINRDKVTPADHIGNMSESKKERLAAILETPTDVLPDLLDD